MSVDANQRKMPVEDYFKLLTDRHAAERYKDPRVSACGFLVDCTCTGGQFERVVPELGFKSMSVRQKKAQNHTFSKLDLLVVFDGFC